MIKIGLALCDRVMDEYTSTRILGEDYQSRKLEKLSFEVVELQLEDWNRYGLFLNGKEELADFLKEGDSKKEKTPLSKSFSGIKV